jgi:hypothetical protein
MKKYKKAQTSKDTRFKISNHGAGYDHFPVEMIQANREHFKKNMKQWEYYTDKEFLLKNIEKPYTGHVYFLARVEGTIIAIRTTFPLIIGHNKFQSTTTTEPIPILTNAGERKQ